MIKALLYIELPVAVADNPAAVAIFTKQAEAMAAAKGQTISEPEIGEESDGKRVVLWNLK